MLVTADTAQHMQPSLESRAGSSSAGAASNSAHAISIHAMAEVISQVLVGQDPVIEKIAASWSRESSTYVVSRSRSTILYN